MNSFERLYLSGLVKQAERSYHHNPLVAALDPTGISSYNAGGMKHVGGQTAAGLGGSVAGAAAGGLGLGALAYLHPGTRRRALTEAGGAGGALVALLNKMEPMLDPKTGLPMVQKGVRESWRSGRNLVKKTLQEAPEELNDPAAKTLAGLFGAGVGGAAGGAVGGRGAMALQANSFNKDNPAPVRGYKKLRDRFS